MLRTGCLIVLLTSLLMPLAPAAQDRLLDATSLDCSFRVISTGTWTAGDASAEVDASTLSLRFEEIDTDGATAEIIGPYGASQIIVRQTGDYLHLVQMFTVGPLYTTTVIDRETVDGRMMAVHTRHELYRHPTGRLHVAARAVLRRLCRGTVGESPAASARRCIPPGQRCASVTYAQYAPSSRLATRAPRHARCYARFHHGLPRTVTP